MGTKEGSGTPSLGTLAAGVAKAQNVAFFSPALQTKTNDLTPSVVRVHLSFTTAANIEYTVDDGTTWNILDTTFIANQGAIYAIQLPIGGKFNLRSTDAAGITVKICQVDEIFR